MERVLIVEESVMIAEAIRREISAKLKFECDVALNFKQAKEKIKRSGEEYFMAILGLNLPDAPEGEIVDHVLAQNIPSLVFTATLNDEIREKMMAENILDYVVKEGQQTVDYLIHVVHRIYKNQSTKVMVVDDSSTSRTMLAGLLKNQRFQVLETGNGKKALELLEDHGDIKMVIMDLNMPGMDGFELTTRIRQRYARDQLAVIGLSAYGSGLLSAKFLKKGANDFINKPFVKEEFNSRINQNIEMLEYIDEIKRASNVDYLTGLYNRRYFFQVGGKMFENARRANFSMTTAMIDIDHFKQVNDTYGHYSGDMVLKYIGKLLSDNLRTADLLARFGGEEFCLITTNMDKKKANVLFERLRRLMEQEKIPTENDRVSDSLEATINRADKMLYQAKQKGRNRVVVD